MLAAPRDGPEVLTLSFPRRDATSTGGIASKRFTAVLDQDYPLAVLAGRHH